MDRQNRGLSSMWRAPFIFVWVVVTIPIFGAACALCGLVSRGLSQCIGTFWMRLFLWLSGIRLVIRGRDKLDRKACYVFFSNHQSMLDIPVLVAGMGNSLAFVAKKELFWIPLMGWGMYGMGHVSIDRSSPRKARSSFSKAVVRLKKEHLSLLLFPEGTRSVDGTIGEFKQGSFTLAIEAGVKLVPVAIHGASACLPKKKLMTRSGTITLSIGDPIDICASKPDKHELMVTVRDLIVRMHESNANARPAQHSH